MVGLLIGTILPFLMLACFILMFPISGESQNQKKKEKYLKKLGIEWDEKLKWEIFRFGSTDVEKRQICVLAFLSEDELRILNHKVIFPKTRDMVRTYECYVDEKDVSSAFELRKKVRFLMTLYQTIKEIKEREQFEALSKTGKETLKQYQKEAEDLEQALMKWIRIDGEQLTFSNEFFLSEDEHLNKLKEKVESARPGNEQVNESTPQKTHPVLLEMTEFLNLNELPDENVLELRQTMEEIQKKIQKEKQDAVSSQKILEAKALNTTAKQFFNIND